MDNSLIFRVVIQEGKGFGFQVQALFCSVTFGKETLTTPYSIATDKHSFNSSLKWSTNKQQLRKLSAAGQGVCKVTVQRKDGSKFGWLVLDLRQAKLNNQYSKEAGAHGLHGMAEPWTPLSTGHVIMHGHT